MSNTRLENIYWSLKDEKHAPSCWRRIYKADISKSTSNLVDVENAPITFCLDKTKRHLVLQQIQENGKIVNLDVKASEAELIVALLYDPVRYPINKTDSISNDILYKLRISLNTKAKLVVLRIYINCDELENILKYNTCMVAPAQLGVLIDELGKEITNRPDVGYYSLISNNIKTAIVPRLSTGLEWIKCLKKAKTPFEYQRANVDWMATIEKGADMKFNKIDYVDYIGLRQYNLRQIGLPAYEEETNPYKLYKSRDGLLFNDETLWSTSDSAILYGGVLCDEVGLGKTLSMVGLIVRNPVLVNRFTTTQEVKQGVKQFISDLPAEHNVLESEKLKQRPKLKIMLKTPILKKNEDVKAPQVQEVQAIQDAADKKLSLNSDALKEDKITDEKEQLIFKDKYGGLYKSVATLVLLPARLCQQWEDEIYSYVESHHKINVIKITTVVQLRNYTYKDLQNADVVIVSYPFLSNKNYTMQEDLNLHNIFWHRIILDEAHEVLFPNSKKILERSLAQAIYSFKSTYRWAVTGDPLAHTRTSFEGILMFLANIGYGDTRNGLLQTMDSKMIDHILGTYFRRNTKLSTKEQIVIPGIKEVVKYLTFSKTEKAIYDNVPADDSKRRLQLCTNILISDKDSDIIGGKVVTMENINNSMKDHYVKVAIEIEDEIAETIKIYDDWQIEYPILLKEQEEKIKVVAQLVLSGHKLTQMELEAYDELKEQKQKLQNKDRYREKATREKLLKLKGDLKDTQEQIKIFTELNASNFVGKPCQICDDSITSDNKLCLNPCGHMNCAGCIDLIFNTKTNGYCPTCRKSISKASIQTISESQTVKDLQKKDVENDTINPILDRWGTKMACLIDYLKEVLKNNESRVILFSQWNQMLEMVSMVLAESRIQHVFCKGNVHMITKSISKFKTDPSIRVIMLSSESCSSGNNLTEASNIILLDTPNTDKEAALAIENQAIGRLVRLGQGRTVEVVRMIIKDTIEEEYYKRNHST